MGIPGLSWNITIVHVASVGGPGLYLDVTIVHVTSIFLGHHYGTCGYLGSSWDVTIVHVRCDSGFCACILLSLTAACSTEFICFTLIQDHIGMISPSISASTGT